MKRITKCRACGSSALTPAFDIETVVDDKRRKGGRSRQVTTKTAFVVCDSTKDPEACGLLQRAEQVSAPSPSAPSGHFRSNRGHLRTAATEALEMISGRDCAALDIGCSDGTLLSFYPRWVDRVGIDTNAIVERVGAWAKMHRASFPSGDSEEALGDRKFDLVSAISVLEDIDDPRAFLNAAKDQLTPDGVLVIETLYAPMVLTRTNIEPVFNGHSAIYALGPLERLFRACGLKIFRGTLTDKNGGSVRLFATHTDVDEYDFDPWYEKLARLWDEENALALRMLAPYQAYEGRALAAREAFAKLVTESVRYGETAQILGTDAAARQLFAWAGAGQNAIEAAVVLDGSLDHGHNESTDRSVEGESGQQNSTSKDLEDLDNLAGERQRLFPGGPELISEHEARGLQADVLIAPATYKRDLLERWREQILRGAKMIFASPQPHIVSATNYSAEFGKALVGAEGTGGTDTLRAILGAAGGPRLVVDRKDDDDRTVARA
ncbi:MAG: class I SAM-dependent methyltransferase [Pseudomonadota bacterium]